MTYEEREKQLCNNCEAKENCSYISRNLERKCSFKETTMYGWELGWQDSIDKAVEWLKNNADKYTDTGCGVPFLYIGIMINDFKKAMEL